MEIITLKVGPLETNCYILAVGKQAAVIDPGGDPQLVIGELEKVGARRTVPLRVDYILNTHGHHDHVLANSEVAAFANRDVYIHSKDEYLLEANQDIFALPVAQKDYQTKPLADQQELDFAGQKIQVLHTPGHTKGSVSFLVAADRSGQATAKAGQAGNLFCGDLLFKQSIGRTDLEGSSPKDMIESLKKVMKLDSKTKVFPGHGSPTEIGDEINNNPFIMELNL